MKLQKLMALSCLLTMAPAMADSIDVNLHDHAMRATYTAQIGGTHGLSSDLGVLHVEGYRDNDIPRDQSETLLHAGLLVSGENWSEGGTLSTSLGGRIVYVSVDTPIDDLDLLAIAFGGALRFTPVPRLGLGVHGYFSPHIASMLDSEGYQEVGVRLDYQLLPQAFIYVGYRDVEADFGQWGDWKMDDSAHFGMKLVF